MSPNAGVAVQDTLSLGGIWKCSVPVAPSSTWIGQMVP
jgi:hypothetical protein